MAGRESRFRHGASRAPSSASQLRRCVSPDRFAGRFIAAVPAGAGRWPGHRTTVC
jgi:hypothetical protein